MRRIVFYVAIVCTMIFVSCEHKELCYEHPHYNELNIVIHWEHEQDIPLQGMRVHLGLIDGNYPIGLIDLPYCGGKIKVSPGNSYRAMCYDYLGSGSLYFWNEEKLDSVAIYTSTTTRASYSALYPNEKLIKQPDNFFMDEISQFKVTGENRIEELHFYPKNSVELYTFEIRNVRGVEHISAFAGACSGISRALLIADNKISDSPYTVLIYEATPVKDKNMITGEFRIIGHCRNVQILHNFTMEVAYAANGYKYKTWDVTDQMHNGGHHLIMEWGVEIPKPEGTGTDMEVDVIPWDEVWIPVEM